MSHYGFLASSDNYTITNDNFTTSLIGKYQVYVPVNDQPVTITVQHPLFLSKTGFYIRTPMMAVGEKYGSSDGQGEHGRVKETQVGDVYTVEFSLLGAGSSFSIFVGAF